MQPIADVNNALLPLWMVVLGVSNNAAINRGTQCIERRSWRSALVSSQFALSFGGAEVVFPRSIASMMVLVAVVVVGIWIVRPGLHLHPSRFQPYCLVLFGLLPASAAAAAWLLALLRIPLPYDLSTLNLMAAVPSILLITGIEELLFRQIMYQWLRKRQVSSRSTVAATALAFGAAHIGPVFLGSPIGATFYLLQSAYLLWIGILLGEIRRTTSSWLMPWLGHFGYNVSTLYVLSILLL